MNFEKPKQILKVGAFVLLTSLPVFSQKGNTEDFNKIAKGKEKEIVLQMVEHGQKGKFGNVDVKRITSPDGSETIVGYDASGKEEWILKQTGDGSRLFLDKDMDGDLDKMILNKSKEGSNASRKGFNEMEAFIPINELSEQAKTEGDLDPQDVFVYEVSDEGNKIISVDFSTGETEELTGDKAKKYTDKLQEMFANILK